MESSSRIYGEECESSESGWTKYICSSIDGEGGCVYDGGGRSKVVVEDEDVETDDSMASDASSGPGQQLGETEEGYGKYNSSRKKYKKALQKKKVGTEERRKDDEKEEVVNGKKGVVSTGHSSNITWFWGRKK